MNLKLWLFLSFLFMPLAHGWEWVHETYEDHCEDYILLKYVDNQGKVITLDQGVRFYIGLQEGQVTSDQFQDRGTGMGMGMTIYLGAGRPTEIVDPVGPGPDGDMHRTPSIPDQEPDPLPLPPDPEPEPEPNPGVWTYNIHNFQNGGCSNCVTWTNDEKVRMRAGEWVSGKVMNDPEMQSKVLNNGCDYQVSGSSYYYGSNPCGSYIWPDIYEARERYWNNVVNYTGDVRNLRVKTGCSFIGSASVPGSIINICRDVYNRNNYSPASTAGNLMHEWTHNMGYGHCGSCSTRSRTVPYRVGQFAREVGTKYNTEAKSLFPRNW